MKNIARTIAALIGLGVVAGGASPAFARSTSTTTAPSVVARVAFSLGSGQDIVDWNKEPNANHYPIGRKKTCNLFC